MVIIFYSNWFPKTDKANCFIKFKPTNYFDLKSTKFGGNSLIKINKKNLKVRVLRMATLMIKMLFKNAGTWLAHKKQVVEVSLDLAFYIVGYIIFWRGRLLKNPLPLKFCLFLVTPNICLIIIENAQKCAKETVGVLFHKTTKLQKNAAFFKDNFCLYPVYDVP